MLQLQNTFISRKFPSLLFIFRIFSYYSVSFGDPSVFVQIHAKTHGYFKVFKSVSIHIQVSKRLDKFHKEQDQNKPWVRPFLVVNHPL